jgi:hypothetical protein
METFSDAIVFGEPPHRRDFTSPTVKGFSQEF